MIQIQQPDCAAISRRNAYRRTQWRTCGVHAAQWALPHPAQWATVATCSHSGPRGWDKNNRFHSHALRFVVFSFSFSILLLQIALLFCLCRCRCVAQSASISSPPLLITGSLIARQSSTPLTTSSSFFPLSKVQGFSTTGGGPCLVFAYLRLGRGLQCGGPRPDSSEICSGLALDGHRVPTAAHAHAQAHARKRARGHAPRHISLETQQGL